MIGVCRTCGKAEQATVEDACRPEFKCIECYRESEQACLGFTEGCACVRCLDLDRRNRRAIEEARRALA